MIYILIRAIDLISNLMFLLVLIYVLISYFMSPYHQFRMWVDRIVEPMLRPIRKVVPLVGMLLFGNLVKEIGNSTERLSKVASGGILNTATIFLGLTVGGTMTAEAFLNVDTLMIIVGGFIAFCLSVAGGIYAVKIYNMFVKKKINPLIGATGLSAVPMASRVANEIALKHDPSNHLLQYAMASNISGVIGSAVAAGVLISFLG